MAKHGITAAGLSEAGLTYSTIKPRARQKASALQPSREQAPVFG
jgi:hypothetical protein